MGLTSQALILAGGLGTRLGDLTQERPKPLIPVGEKPFLEWLILLLRHHGIKQFVLCVSYKAHQIQDYFLNGEKFDCDIRYSVEVTPLGTGGAIQQAAGLLDETFLILNGDNYLALDYQNFIETFHQTNNSIGLIACWRNDPPIFRSNLTLDEKTKSILAYDYQNPEGKTHIDCGVKIFSQKLLNFFKPNKTFFSLEIDIMGRLAEKRLLCGYPVNNPPLDIGIPENLETARKGLLKAS